MIAYNAEGAEKIRLQELAARFPERAKPLMKIHSRMVDLAFPFQAGLFYDTRMRGYYSLKTLLPLFDENLTYQDLDIHQGMDAVVQWRNLDQNNDQSDHQAIRDHLFHDYRYERIEKEAGGMGSPSSTSRSGDRRRKGD